MDHYVLKWRGGAKFGGTVTVTRIWLVGPFAVHSEAVEWAEKDQAERGDDPRWQIVNPEVGRGATSLELPVRTPWDRKA